MIPHVTNDGRRLHHIPAVHIAYCFGERCGHAGTFSYRPGQFALILPRIFQAYFYAWARKDLVKAKEYWGKIQSNPAIEEAEIHATQAAIAKLEGDYKLALENIEQAIRKAPLMISPGSATMLLEQMQSLRESLA